MRHPRPPLAPQPGFTGYAGPLWGCKSLCTRSCASSLPECGAGWQPGARGYYEMEFYGTLRNNGDQSGSFGAAAMTTHSSEDLA